MQATIDFLQFLAGACVLGSVALRVYQVRDALADMFWAGQP